MGSACTLFPGTGDQNALPALHTSTDWENTRNMGINGIWIAIMGILALPGGAIITRWMSPIGSKAWGMIAGVLGGLLGIALLEVLGGNLAGIPPVIPGADAFTVAVLSFLGVSAASAAIGLLLNWLLYSWQHKNEMEERFAE